MPKKKNQPPELSPSSGDQPGHIPDSSEGSYRFTEWSGAIVFYALNFGRRKFNYYYHKRFERRNFWMGWVIRILVVLLFFILFLGK